jgi:hypothetical protein
VRQSRALRVSVRFEIFDGHRYKHDELGLHKTQSIVLLPHVQKDAAEPMYNVNNVLGPSVNFVLSVCAHGRHILGRPNPRRRVTAMQRLILIAPHATGASILLASVQASDTVQLGNQTTIIESHTDAL